MASLEIFLENKPNPETAIHLSRIYKQKILNGCRYLKTSSENHPHNYIYMLHTAKHYVVWLSGINAETDCAMNAF